MSRRILVCDDHPVVRDAIAVCLKAISPECEVAECATMRQAVERVAAPGHWDLVVLDLMLPDAVGVDALIQLRRAAPALRIVVLSARDDRDTVERAIRAGAIEYLPKSADRGRLVSSLQRLLGLADTSDPSGALRAGTARDTAGDASWVHEAVAAMSPRQMQVLRLMLRGLPNKEICRELGVSENTVKIHIGTVLRALRARNRTEAVGLASRVGLGIA
jgi:DNA-binding NarL/FixJ family response regulator